MLSCCMCFKSYLRQCGCVSNIGCYSSTWCKFDASWWCLLDSGAHPDFCHPSRPCWLCPLLQELATNTAIHWKQACMACHMDPHGAEVIHNFYTSYIVDLGYSRPICKLPMVMLWRMRTLKKAMIFIQFVPKFRCRSHSTDSGHWIHWAPDWPDRFLFYRPFRPSLKEIKEWPDTSWHHVLRVSSLHIALTRTKCHQGPSHKFLRYSAYVFSTEFFVLNRLFIQVWCFSSMRKARKTPTPEKRSKK